MPSNFAHLALCRVALTTACSPTVMASIGQGGSSLYESGQNTTAGLDCQNPRNESFQYGAARHEAVAIDESGRH
jgi:hypothetical protein